MIPPLPSSLRPVRLAFQLAAYLGLLPVVATAAAPVITVASPEVHYYFVPEDRNTAQFGYLIVANNSPTSYDATGLPPNAFINRTTGSITGGLEVPGLFPLTLRATNADGTGTAQVRLAIHPAFIGVATSRGDFTPGQTFTISLTSNRALFVTGRPAVPFTASVGARNATYVSGSGTATLVFGYTVAAGDTSNGQQIQVLNVDMAGGTIRDVDGLDPSPRLPLRFFSSGITLATPVTPLTVASGSATATVGQSFTYTVTSTGNPTTFTATGLPAGLVISNAGVISGAPTTAGTFTANVTASNASGGSGSGTLSINVAAATLPPTTTPPTPPTTPPTPPTTTPPPTTPPPPTTTPPAPAPPTTPPAAPAPQTISITPIASLIVGQPIRINATASSQLPVSLTVVSGNATLNGDQLTVNDEGPVIVRATQSGSGAFASSVADITVRAGRAAQSIDFATPVSTIVIGQPVLLGAAASSGLPVTYSVVSGPATINGNALTVTGTGPVVVRATQAGSSSVNPASSDVTITGAVRAAQVVDFAVPASELMSDRTLSLGATSTSGLPVTFEVVSGPATIAGTTLTPTGPAGVVTVRARQAGSEAFAAAESTRVINVLTASRLINLSSRVRVRDGDASRSFIAGFVVSGAAPKQLLVRAVGPALAEFGVQSALANPRLRVVDQSGRVLGENDDWSGSDTTAAFARLGAFGLAAGARDAAMLVTLPPGAYSLQVDANGSEGVALAEIYDASNVPSIETQQIVNLSTRAHVDTGESVLTAGFVVTGSVPKRVLIRGVGPALAGFGVPAVLADPTLNLYAGDTIIAQNDDWQTPQPRSTTQTVASSAELTAAFASAGAFPLSAGAKDAALIVELPPGAYTAIVSGANATTGAGLVEVYELAASGR